MQRMFVLLGFLALAACSGPAADRNAEAIILPAPAPSIEAAPSGTACPPDDGGIGGTGCPVD